ncbi:MAG: 4a-hydroxytetrahydrobiopterin dehydratase [Candidatus Melainabacteria bacterium HGW-Melainabacteria-1]|nr:MAG: 4a-hydroxytetrahydrobiopterin dehydratase [Candidatus Melainabacteria bacterium HGW-Melainabacteria-1]
MSEVTSERILDALKLLPGWSYEGHALRKEFAFKNFREAISFIVRLSYEAEERDHHPEILNVYNRVTINLTTHDAGNQVTEKDLHLAEIIEGFNWVD